MATSTQTLYIDTNNQNENFVFETTEGSTPTLRVYLYEDGSAFNVTADQTAKFIYAVNREASEMVEVDGTIVAGVNYIDFTFTTAKTAINGKFFASIILYETGSDKIWVQKDGMIILKKNPALDGATTLDTTTTINWGLYTNLPPYPWSIGNEVTSFTDCSDSPYHVSVDEASTTFIVSGACDFIFHLPKATTDNIGKVYGFMHLNKAYTLTIRAAEGDTINDSADGGQVTSVRNYCCPSSMHVRQTTASKYNTFFADGAFLTEESQYSSSSSSTSSASSSSSSA